MFSEIQQAKLLILYAPVFANCGIGTSIEALYREMEKRGWDVTIGLAWGEIFHNPRNFERFHPGLKTTWMDARTGSEEGRVQAIIRTIKKVKPSIVFHTYLNSAFEAARRLRAKGFPFQFVVANRGSMPEQAACLIENRDAIDYVTCVNRLSYLTMLSFKDAFPSDRIHYIPNGVPPPVAPPQRLEQGPKRVGYAGRLTKDKRFQDIFPFFRSLSDLNASIELWVAGDGSLAEEIKKLSNEFPGRVKYFGSLSRDELYRNFYPAIDVLIHFSPTEGWSLSIGEAMINGVVPVVSTFSGIYTEALLRPNHNALFFPIGDTDAAAKLVEALLRDPQCLTKLSNQAKELILHEFSLDQFGERWSKRLTSFLSKTSKAALPRKKVALLNREMRLEPYKEMLRRLLRRRFLHRYAGEEWPPLTCRNRELLEQVRMRMHAIEQDHKALVGPIDEASEVGKLQSMILRGTL